MSLEQKKALVLRSFEAANEGSLGVENRFTASGLQLLRLGEASRILHVHCSTLKRWSDQGKIKAYRIGPRGDRRFRRIDIEALVNRTNQRIDKARRSK